MPHPIFKSVALAALFTAKTVMAQEPQQSPYTPPNPTPNPFFNPKQDNDSKCIAHCPILPNSNCPAEPPPPVGLS